MSPRDFHLLSDAEPATVEELAAVLNVDVRFFRISEQAGFSLQNGKGTLGDFWRWFSFNTESFRRAAGMRRYTGPQASRPAEEPAARYLATLVTVNEFFGVLPCKTIIDSATRILRPTLRKHPPKSPKNMAHGPMPVSVPGLSIDH